LLFLAGDRINIRVTHFDALPTLLPPPAPGFPQVLVKQQPEDFIVEELPLYEPSGGGTHTYLWIEKRGINTHDAVRRLAAVIGKRGADAGVGGLKDAVAITRQWISFEHVKENRDALVAYATPELKVLQMTAHGNKLKMGHLRGNRFTILLRLAENTSDARTKLFERAKTVCAQLRTLGVPNYYGPQRFGRGEANAALGRLLVRGDREGFQRAYTESHGDKRLPDRKLRNLLVNAFQSELFNRVLALRMPELGRLLPGDLACLHRNGAVFAVNSAEDAAREQPRADALEISPSGPLFGPQMPSPQLRPREIEDQIIAESGVAAADFGRREAESQPGARRSLRTVLMEDPVVEIANDGVTLRFALPSGSYASIVLREITGTGLDV
jgi:tRNA pseudouridine13 synthase